MTKNISLKLFIIFSLFFPAFYSPFNEEYKIEYYAVFTVAYGVLLLYLAWQFFKGKQKQGQRFLMIYLAGILLYNLLSFYMNIRYLHWYGEQINNTIAFLFFFFLCLYENSFGEQRDEDRLIVFFLRCVVLSNILSIIYFFMGYTSLIICNNQVHFYQLSENYYEFRHYWLYSHKSDYALMLTAFIAVTIRFRDKFHSRLTWCFSMFVLLFALFLTHSWTGFGATGLVFLGALLDKIDWKKLRFRKRYLLWGLLGLVGGGTAWRFILGERDVLSMGGRLWIWSGAVKEILKTPTGWGYWFGEVLFEATPYWQVNNAHNVFLNALLRFSIPVGICFILLFLMIMAYSLWKSRTWLAVGMWLGFLVLLNMDYSLLNYEMGMFLFIVYLVCIYEQGKRGRNITWNG